MYIKRRFYENIWGKKWILQNEEKSDININPTNLRSVPFPPYTVIIFKMLIHVYRVT